MTLGELVDAISQEVRAYLGSSHNVNLSMSLRPLGSDASRTLRRRLEAMGSKGLPYSWRRVLSKSRLKRLDSLALPVLALVGRYALDELSRMETSLERVGDSTIESLSKELGVERPLVNLHAIVNASFLDSDLKARVWRSCLSFRNSLMGAISKELALDHGAMRIEAQVETLALRLKSRMQALEDTESSRVANLCSLKVLSKAGAKSYIVSLGEGESRCEVCKEFDGKSFPIKDATPGVNLPPFHPHCSCTVRGVFIE